jgi:hypothetical protein
VTAVEREVLEYNLLVEVKVDVERIVALMSVTLMSTNLQHTKDATTCPVNIVKIEELNRRTLITESVEKSLLRAHPQVPEAGATNPFHRSARPAKCSNPVRVHLLKTPITEGSTSLQSQHLQRGRAARTMHPIPTRRLLALQVVDPTQCRCHQPPHRPPVPPGPCL